MKGVVGLVVVLGMLSIASGDLAPPVCTLSNILENSLIASGFCPFIFTELIDTPRGIVVADNGDLLVVERGTESVIALWANKDAPLTSTESDRVVLGTAPGLNHGIDINDGYLYASSETDVYRWPYTAGDRTFLGEPTHVMKNVPCCHHVTRAVRFDPEGNMYVQVGSASNVDKDTTHARINRFSLPANESSFPLDWNDGYVFANGLRNEAGMNFDKFGRLWGMENGVDMLFREDLGGDIHDDNPGEELNLFDVPGKFYGYPYCWSEYKLAAGMGPGTQWAHPDFMPEVNDTWCQDPANVVPPKNVNQAHMAPLGITFWDDEELFAPGRLSAMVPFHGSWNRNPPAGYRVDYYNISHDGNDVVTTGFLKHAGEDAYGPGWIRPVSVATGKCAYGRGECLYITSDSSGQVIAIGADE